MPTIYDNIEQDLLPALTTALALSERSDFCVGYFNLRGWRQVDHLVERWSGGSGQQCRLLVGMQKLPRQELRDLLTRGGEPELDNATAVLLKRRLATEFRDQLTVGFPTNEDEQGLRRLLAQLRAGKVIVKLFLRFPLHAKLYLLFRPDPVNPIISYLGSSNLTFSGLSGQGELNVDVLDKDACEKLASWFRDRWDDRWCIDITKDLISILEESWAREEPLLPYFIYLKIAYHLSHEARAGLAEFRLPSTLRGKLFEFQEAAVRIAARHLQRRGGVMLGDVVGLGKTLMATAIIKVFEELQDLEVLILCPKNLEGMWKGYQEIHGIRGKVLRMSRAISQLPDLKRYRLVVVDESHNLRNREGKTWRAIRDYIDRNDSKCVLLSATPYNKSYLDLSGQLGLFLDPEADLGIRPENLLRELGGEAEFIARHQAPVRSLAAFDWSIYPDDWRELMRLYLVRRTRGFIMEHYAKTDPKNGRKYLEFPDSNRSYFPDRVPRTVTFKIDESDPKDLYAKLYGQEVVDAINGLRLPRYGLGNYVFALTKKPPTQAEAAIIGDLSRAGNRLRGFCRTNLFKRLESSGDAFLLSLERHILRNFVFIHALEHGLPLPVGKTDAAALDTSLVDEDDNAAVVSEDGEIETTIKTERGLRTDVEFRARAKQTYVLFEAGDGGKFRWIRPDLFHDKQLHKDLLADSEHLLKVLSKFGQWDGKLDNKLHALLDLLRRKHPKEKVLVFTQFADTANYLWRELATAKIAEFDLATGAIENPAALAWRFSPKSNEWEAQVKTEGELRILLATDVLSEGQNLQDAHIVVNYDLPWAIIRLIQRAGRVDRIGQTAEKILCYSFLPAEGVERIIALRGRLRTRLSENAEVVGTDEAFFEGEMPAQTLKDLYTEKAGLLDDDKTGEVDLASYAYQIWKEASDPDKKAVEALPDVVYSTKVYPDVPKAGALVFVRTGDDNDALAWVNKAGETVTESQFEILKAAECPRDEAALARQDRHHELVQIALQRLAEETKATGGHLGTRRSVAYRAYERLKGYAESLKQSGGLNLGDTALLVELEKIVSEIYQYPMRQVARDSFGAALRANLSDRDLAQLAIRLKEDGRLVAPKEDGTDDEGVPRIICSLGLVAR